MGFSIVDTSSKKRSHVRRTKKTETEPLVSSSHASKKGEEEKKRGWNGQKKSAKPTVAHSRFSTPGPGPQSSRTRVVNVSGNRASGVVQDPVRQFDRDFLALLVVAYSAAWFAGVCYETCVSRVHFWPAVAVSTPDVFVPLAMTSFLPRCSKQSEGTTR